VPEVHREVDMEHRWGIRRTLDVGVKLYVRPSLPGFGRLLDASASGAYVATSMQLPIMTRVQIAIGWDSLQGGGRQRITAYVVRADGRGLGIEWRQFAPPPVLALIDGPKAWSLRGRRRAAIQSEPSLAMARPARVLAVQFPPGRLNGMKSPHAIAEETVP
jgi:hypothetical protein